MPHNTKAILVDVNGRPIPQYFNPITDQYEPLYGVAGAARSVLYGPDGQPISASNRLPVDVGGTVDISDRADRQLGQVTLTGSEVERAKLTTPITVSPGSTVTALNDIAVLGSRMFVNVKIPLNEPAHDFHVQILHRWAEVAGTFFTLKIETHAFQNSQVGIVGPIDVMTPHVSVRITNADNEAHQYVVYLGAHT